jgi:hypothetical protein
MPRFSSPNFASPLRNYNNPETFESSVRLCCNGGTTNSKLMYVLRRKERQFIIDTHTLDEDQQLTSSTPLPDDVQASFEIDPPVEIFCMSTTQPLFCFYSRRSVFIWDLQQEQVTEPLESVTSGFSNSIVIVRVRPGPQYDSGYAATSPAGSLAILLRDTTANLHSLVLYHHAGTGGEYCNSNKQQTTPLVFGEEYLDGPESDSRLVDFTFGQSYSGGELDLLPSLAVFLLKGSGDVLVASPIIFDGTIVNRSLFDNAREYFVDQVASLTPGCAKWRQCRAATVYLKDVFPAVNKKSHFVTARVLGENVPESVLNWPVQIQGPLLFAR